jgi:hypothetical protein
LGIFTKFFKRSSLDKAQIIIKRLVVAKGISVKILKSVPV